MMPHNIGIMDEDYLRNLREGTWGCESETSSFSHSDIRHPWEDEVNSQGELFYVIHYPPHEESADSEDGDPSESATDKTNTGILGRFMRRRSSRRSFRRSDEKGITKQEKNTPFGDTLCNSLPQKLDSSKYDSMNIYMKIDFPNIKIIGRRSTAVETFLGMKVTFQGTQIIINDVIPNSAACALTAFRKGDWLHSINGIVMTPENIENYLRNISFSKEVKEVVITVNRIKPVIKCVPSASSSLDDLDNYELEGFSVIFLCLGRNTEVISSEDVAFSYPSEGNIISTVKGTFLTLLHLLPSLAANQPISTTLSIQGQVINVMYTKKDDGLLLLAMPESRMSLSELFWVNNDVIRCLLFTFQSLSRCFSSERNLNSLKKFFRALFKRVIHRCLDSNSSLYEFESILPAVASLPLPSDIYVQVDDALNELEANDVEGFEDQKLYSIIGSVYFYKGYNICSHFGKEDIVDIYSLCRQSDILAFMKGGVSELVFWKEVFPSSVSRGLGSNIHVPYSLLPSSWYLLIVAKDQHFLFVLLESGGYTLRPLQNPGPDVAYVEEALETLKHIIKIGVSQVGNKLIKENDEFISKPSLNTLSGSTEPSLLSSSLSETALNKHHSLSYRSLDNCQLSRSRSNINVITASGYDSVSSDDCAPVLGRRAERELAMETLSRASDISDDSDMNKDFKSNRSQSTDSQEPDINFLPKIITGKPDVMLHYVYLDQGAGILMSSVNNSEDCTSLLNNFRLHAHKIHKILMNTISFKKLKAQEVSSSTINKSMVAIKEHGILFDSKKERSDNQFYWVVGRIFFNPYLREVYLCYQDSCPQNMVEVAFRLALNCPSS